MKANPSSLSRNRIKCDFATVSLHHAPNCSQPESSASVALRRKERLKHALGNLGSHAWPVIAHDEQETTGGPLGRGRNRHGTTGLLKGIARVLDEVQNHLLKRCSRDRNAGRFFNHN